MLTRARRWLRWKLGPRGFSELHLVHSVLTAPGVMVDAGAHHGGSLYPFAKEGWWVYAFEPDTRNRTVLKQAAAGLRRVVIDPRAIGERDGEELPLFTSEVSTGISTLRAFHSSHRSTTTAITVRFDTALADVDEVTLLKTDLEGWDLIALRTFPWDRLRPRVVVCEFEDRKTVPLGYTFHDLARFLVAGGYLVLVSEWYPVVEYGQQHRWRSLRPYPVELADPDGWGNLIGEAD